MRRGGLNDLTDERRVDPVCGNAAFSAVPGAGRAGRLVDRSSTGGTMRCHRYGSPSRMQGALWTTAQRSGPPSSRGDSCSRDSIPIVAEPPMASPVQPT